MRVNVKGRNQDFISDIDREVMYVHSDDPSNRLSAGGQTIRAKVDDHDELLAEPGSKRDIEEISDPFLEFSWMTFWTGIVSI